MAADSMDAGGGPDAAKPTPASQGTAGTPATPTRA